MNNLDNYSVDFYKFYNCIPRCENINQEMPEWYIFNKNDAERLCEHSLSDDKYRDIMYHITQITDKYLSDICICENGVFTNGCGTYASQELIGEIIDRLTDIYNDYENYYNRFMLNNFVKYYEQCMLKKNEFIKIKEKKKKTHNGYIYVMKCIGTYKIGKSVNLLRCGEYTNLPEKPTYPIVEYVDDINSLEKEIHEKFTDVRRRDGKCEWFDLDEKDLKIIKKMLEPHIIKETNKETLLKTVLNID